MSSRFVAFSLVVAVALSPETAIGDSRSPAPIRSAPTPVEGSSSSGAGVATLRAPTTDRVLIRAGSFMMGSDALDIADALTLCETEPLGAACMEVWFGDEYPRHEVYLSDYQIGRREVTVGEFRRCVEAGPCAAPPLAAGGRRFDRNDYPVTMVTWNDASTYCGWAGGRLPTEAEWERAARGRASRHFPWGNVYNPFLLNAGRFSMVASFDDRDGFAELAPVGSFPGGRTPDGIDDLAGNVAEWVSDYYAPEYPEADQKNPTGPDVGDEKVIRGGSFADAKAIERSAKRQHDLGSIRRYWRGFRCAWVPPPSR